MRYNNNYIGMQTLKKIKSELSGHNFFKDGWLLGFVVLIVVADSFLMIWSVSHIHRSSIELPVRFTSLSNFDQLGPWYQIYQIPAIAIMVTIINVFLAILLHRKNRILSIFLLISALMVSILAIAILLGFTVIKYGTN